MPKFTKGHYSLNIFQNLFKSKPGHLLVITNHFTKFQDSSFNSFWDILLTRKKCPNLQRAINHEIFFRIYSKVNQVISSSINSPNFKALAPTVFRYFVDKVKMPKVTEGQNSWSIFQILKLIRSQAPENVGMHWIIKVESFSRCQKQLRVTTFVIRVIHNCRKSIFSQK